MFFYPDDSEILETWISISSFKYFKCLQFLWYKSLQKVNFFDHLPPSSCKGSLWTPPNNINFGRNLLSYLFIVHDLLITGSSQRGISDSTSPLSNRAGGSRGQGREIAHPNFGRFRMLTLPWNYLPPEIFRPSDVKNWTKRKRQGLWKQGEGG